jgi:hypothetical protein
VSHTRSIAPAAPSSGLLGHPSLVLGQPLLQVGRRFELRFLGLPTSTACTRALVACRGASFGLSLIELLNDALVVGLKHVLGYPLHAENLNVQRSAVAERIIDTC